MLQPFLLLNSLKELLGCHFEHVLLFRRVCHQRFQPVYFLEIMKSALTSHNLPSISQTFIRCNEIIITFCFDRSSLINSMVLSSLWNSLLALEYSSGEAAG
jgi:hypothetical protein